MPCTLNGELTIITVLDGDIALDETLDGENGVFQEYSTYEEYHGTTEVTPSAEAQVLNTDHFLMGSDITINPIPSNYGLITWNGATLTVS